MNKAVVAAGGLGGVLVVGAAGFAGVVAMSPSHSHIERSQVVAASPADVYPFANDMHEWLRWNPWDAMEPTSKKTFSENAAGVGAWYTWEGEQVGSGKMTVSASVPNEKVSYDLQFTAPFEAAALVTFTLTPEGEGTRVVWSYDADMGFAEKAMGLFVDMDAMLGADFEKGLTMLAPLAADAASKRVAAEAEAKAAAEAAAAEALALAAAEAALAAPPQ